MRLTVLGGSAAGGNEGAGCSGYLVDSGRTRVVLDLGPGTLLQLRRHCDFRLLNGIVISHMHLDHILDLCALRFALAYNPVKIGRRVPLWLPPNGSATLTKIGAGFAGDDHDQTFFDEVFEIREYVPDQTLTIGDLDVEFAPTVHYIPGWAMRVSAPEQRPLGYTADTGPAAALDSFFHGCGVLISEATLLNDRNEPWDTRGHLTATEAGRLAYDSRAETLVVSHYWQEVGTERLLQQARAVFPGRVVLGGPGVTVEWS